MRDVFLVGVVLLFLAILAALAPTVWRTPNAALRRMWLSFCCLTVTLVVFHPRVYGVLDAALGVPNAREPIGRVFVLVAGYLAQSMLLRLLHEDGPPRRQILVRRLALAVAVTGVTVAFVAASPLPEIEYYSAAVGETGGGLAYLAVFGVHLGYILVDVMRLCLRYARQSEQLVGFGLRLTATGCALGLGYLVDKAGYAAASLAGVTPSAATESLVAHSLALAGLVLIVVGTTLPRFGPRIGLERLVDGWVAYRAAQRLYPLWAALRQQVPEIALEAPSGRVTDALRLGRPRYRLYRRVIEIHDALLVLRRRCDGTCTVCSSVSEVDADADPRAVVSDIPPEAGQAGDLLDEARRLALASETLLRVGAATTCPGLGAFDLSPGVRGDA